MQKQVLHNQSLFDIAIQENGTVMSAFEIALKNGLCLTDELTPGQNLEVTVSALFDADLVSYFKTKGLLIATGFHNNETIIPQLGIGKMIIGRNFIVG